MQRAPRRLHALPRPGPETAPVKIYELLLSGGRVEAVAGGERRLWVRLPLGVRAVELPERRPGTASEAAREDGWRPGLPVTVGIRPERVRILGEAGEVAGPPGENRVWARVERVVAWGAFDGVHLDAGVPLVADAGAGSLPALGAGRGSRLLLELPAAALHPIREGAPGEDGEGEGSDGF
ncbi:MAG: hypothetical protein QJR14_08905 [Bacillota bacterium]|nr:hypothetical protein [Bacillota bacterium]